MATAAVEVASNQWRGLEPEGRGHELMQTWALYRRGGERTKSPIASGNWSERLDEAHDNEPPFVLVIDRMLASLFRAGYEDTVDIAKRFYLSNLAVWEIAPKVRRTEGFIRLTLRGVCALAEERVPE